MKHVFTQIFFLAALAAFFPNTADAQDPRFSQYYNSPFNLNPAMSGVFNGRYRVVANYRDQWSSFLAPVPFKTFSTAFDLRYNVNNDDYFAVSVGAMHDQAGTSQFNQNKGHLGASFLKQLSGGRYSADHFLSAGAQVGFGQNSVDWSKLWFSRQFDPSSESPNTSLGNGETNTNGSSNVFLDFNAGLLWYVVMEDESFIYAGASMNHINQPNISLYENGDERMYARWNAHAGGLLMLNDNFGIQPGIQAMRQGPAFETDLGMNVRYTNNDLNELTLRAGVWSRIGNKLNKGLGMDALTFVGMIELNRFTFGLSYDVTTSSLTRANNSRGAFELSLMYIHPEHRRQKVKCPKF